MEQSFSRESDSSSASQEIPRIVCNPEFHYPVQKILSHVAILSQLSPFHALPTDFFKIHSNSHVRLGVSSGLFPSGFHTKTYMDRTSSPYLLPALPVLLLLFI
jgi:hypothetical protein